MVLLQKDAQMILLWKDEVESFLNQVHSNMLFFAVTKMDNPKNVFQTAPMARTRFIMRL